MRRIYLDVSCLNRPFDDQAQERVRLEAEAIVLVVARFRSGEWRWISSEMVNYEASQTPDPERRVNISELAALADEVVPVTEDEVSRAHELEALGFPSADAVHLACAESGDAEIFLTTDQRLIRVARRRATRLGCRVENPLTWIQEVAA